MGTDIRPEVSKKNNYWLSKHRYYQLLHWCRQYDEWWAKKMDCITAINTASVLKPSNEKNNDSIVEKAYEQLESINKKIEIIHTTIKEADPELSDYILFSVTKGVGYTNLKTLKDIPCSKNYFYDKYRKFFWILDKKLD